MLQCSSNSERLKKSTCVNSTQHLQVVAVPQALHGHPHEGHGPLHDVGRWDESFGFRAAALTKYKKVAT